MAGHVAAAEGRFDDALGSYRRARGFGPHRAAPLIHEGNVLARLGRPFDALDAFERALDLEDGERSASYSRSAELAGGRIPFAAPIPLLPILYALVLLLGEALVTFVNPLLVFPLHGGLVVAVSIHLAWLARHPAEADANRPLTALLLAFVLAPLIRIISLTLPLAQIEPAYRYLFAGIPMALGALLVARALGMSLVQMGLVWRDTRLQVLVVVASVGLGFIEFAILRPAPMGGLPWTVAGVLPAIAVGIFTGLPEEMIFRGVLQTAARPIMAGGTVLYTATVFAVLHIGYESAVDLAFVFGVGLFYGWVFERTRSIVGTSIGHGLANVILFFVAPYLLPGLIGHPIF